MFVWVHAITVFDFTIKKRGDTSEQLRRGNKLFLTGDDAWDSLQIVGDLHRAPSFQQPPNAFDNGAAYFHNQPAAQSQLLVSLRKQARNHLDPGGPSKNGSSRLEFSYLELNLVLFRFADIGWVRNNKVELSIDASEQIRVVKFNTIAHL
jgi:hypothetical protein